MREKSHDTDSGTNRRVERTPAGDRVVWPEFFQDEARGGPYGLAPEAPKSAVDYIRNVVNRKWTVAAVVVAGISVAAFHAFTATPVYVSRATVQVEKLQPKLGQMDDLLNAFGQYDVYYQTQIEALRSRDLAAAFLDRMAGGKGKQRETESNRSAEDQEPAAQSSPTSAKADSHWGKETEEALAQERQRIADVQSVLSRITVQGVPGTQLISVEMSSDNPAEAKRMLQVYLEAYLDESFRIRSQVNSRVKAWLDTELEESKKLLMQSQDELLEFTKKHGIVDLEGKPQEVVSAFERASDSFVKSKVERFNLETMMQTKEEGLPADTTENYLQSLKGQLNSLRAKYAEMQPIYDPNYFKMNFIRNKIKATEDAITEIEKGNLASALDAAKKKESLSEKVYEKTKDEAINSNSFKVQYDILRKALEANRQLHFMIRQRSKQAELDHGMMGHNVVISSAPTLPISPVYPKKDRILLIGALLGLLGGIAAAICLEYLDDTVKSTQEIEKWLSLPILGAVPKLSSRTGPLGLRSGPRVEFLAHHDPLSPFADAARIVQNSAVSLLPAKSAHAVCISSALPMEGKTFLAVLMSTVTASENKKVLLIDGDLRKPRVHRIFEIGGAYTGLSDVISGKCARLTEAVRESHIPNLYYLPAGSVPDNPVALLKTGLMRDVLDACRKAFDLVVVDAPPVLGVVDARILAGYTDGAIMVTRARHTPVDVLRQAKDAMVQAQVRLLGMVLNMADSRSDRYNYYYYRYYYHKK
jgi:capsular exopolysaccharide synthesis family protein